MPNESILVRGVNWLGDAVMSTPALIRLRAARPDARIILLTHEKLRELWTGHPAVNEVVTFAARDPVFRVGRKLRGLACGTALILPNSPRSAIEMWLAKIPRRVGMARPWRNWFLTERLSPREGETPMTKRTAEEVRLLIETGVALKGKSIPTDAHHIHHYLHLARVLGAQPEPCVPSLAISEDEGVRACEKFGATIRANRVRPLIGVNPGAEYGPAKRWPRERFAEAATAFHQLIQSDWWIFGGPADRAVAEEIAKAMRSRLGDGGKVECLAGRTTLRELCAASKAVDLFLTNDSGPMHVAAAVGTPVVALFGSTSPELTGPGLPGENRHRLLRETPACSPCFLRECPIDFRCMTGISVEKVVAAMRQLIESRRDRK